MPQQCNANDPNIVGGASQAGDIYTDNHIAAKNDIAAAVSIDF